MKNHTNQTNSFDPLRNVQANRLSWLWLVIGFLLLPFTMVQTVISLSAWLAPAFLLRFVRTYGRVRIALPLIFVAYALGITIAMRGGEASSVGLFIYGVVVFSLIRGLLYTLPYAADRLIGARLGPWARMLVFPLAFTTVDWLMSLSKIINSTASPAYSQYDNLALLQILSITGMWGITFLIMWFASTMNALWEHGFDWRPVRGLVGVFTGVLLAVFLFGSVRLNFFHPPRRALKRQPSRLTTPSARGHPVELIGRHFNQSSDAERAAVRPQFEATVDQLLARTETALRGGAKMVAWQEGAGTVLEEDKQGTLGQVAELARKYDAYLQVSFGVLTRTQAQHFILNQSILVDNTGAIRWTYEKTYLVIPTESYVVVAGDGQLPAADMAYGRLSTAICNDLHFLLFRQAGEQSVDILIAPYNDFHPWESEDAVTATYRAIENGFSMVRPAGHGISTIVDYEGRVLARQNYFTDSSGIMLTTVPTRGVRTVYSRIGDLFAYLCVAGLLVLTGRALFHRKQAVSAEITG